MSGERSTIQAGEHASRLGTALGGFNERAARPAQGDSDTALWQLLREMIRFRSEEAMTWKDPADLVHWNELNELIRQVHRTIEGKSH